MLRCKRTLALAPTRAWPRLLSAATANGDPLPTEAMLMARASGKPSTATPMLAAVSLLSQVPQPIENTSFAWWATGCLALLALLSMAWGFRLRRRLAAQALQLHRQRIQEQALENEFNEWVENAPDLILNCAPDGRILSVNRAGERLTGFTRPQLVGSLLEDLLLTGRELSDLIAHPSSFEPSSIMELRLRTAGKELVPVEVRCRVLRREHRPSQIQFVARDIRERRQAQDALRQSEDVYRDMFEKNNAVKLLVHPGSGEIVDANLAASRFYGRNLEDLRRTRFQDLGCGSTAQIQALLGRVLASEVDLFHLVQTTAEARQRHVEVYGCPLTVSGRLLIFCIVLDVTEQVLATQAIQRLNSALELQVQERTEQLQRRIAEVDALNEELEAFSYSVSHDLRAPLRHINGFIQVLEEEEKGKLGDESIRCIRHVRQAANRMTELIDGLLGLSHLGRSTLQKQWVEGDALMRDVLGELTPEAKGRHIRWVVHPLPRLYVDPSLMRQGLLNILSNALKYTQPRPQALIEIGSQDTSKESSEVILYIRDNGVGFDMDYAGKLFGAFQRLHSEKEFEGTGIGLANVRRIVHRHGGRVWAEGRTDVGATFYLALPLLNSTPGLDPSLKDKAEFQPLRPATQGAPKT